METVICSSERVYTVLGPSSEMKVNTNTQHQLEMFHQEARLMRMYDHRNVVKLHGMVYSEDDVMVVMELVSGGGLNTDVAARNCLVTTDGRMIKLSDFGLAAHGSRIKLPSTERVPIRWFVV
ncbi:hypothetical protein OSTOST_20120 [Ostertagia ostertagi]